MFINFFNFAEKNSNFVHIMLCRYNSLLQVLLFMDKSMNMINYMIMILDNKKIAYFNYLFFFFSNVISFYFLLGYYIK